MPRSCIAICGFVFGLLLVPPLTHAVDPSCKPALDAASKSTLTASHVYATETAAYTHNQPQLSEMIYSGGLNGPIYVMVQGKWTRSRMTPGEMLKMKDENASTAKNTCRYLRDESVNGEAAAVYASHSDTDSAKVDATLWVSKSRGLLLREDVDMDVGGTMGKSHRAMRFDYSNVHPPAGVQ